MSNWQIVAEQARAMDIFKERLALAHTSLENRCAETGFIRIAPKVQGRILNIRDPIEHDD